MPIKNSVVEGNLRFKVLPENLRKRFRGSIDYKSPDSSEKWLYDKKVVDGQDGSTADIFADGSSYLYTDEVTDIDVDYCKFIILKHTGFTNVEETATVGNLGVMFTFTGDRGNATVAHDGTATEQFIWLEPGDSIAIKIPRVRLDKMHARVATLGLSGPTANGSSTTKVLIEYIALIRDGGVGT